MYKHQLTGKNFLFAAVSVFFLTLLLPPANVTADDVSTRIVNGKIVPPGKYPWMVALLYNYGGSAQDDFVCGGSLIDRQWVLTAAHCVDGTSPESLSISVNAVDLRKEDEIDRIPVTDIVMHSSYTNLGYRDIALLRLQRKVARNIPTLKLIDSETTLDVGTKITTMGWGKTESFTFGRDVSRRLQETDLEVGFRQICENYSAPFLPDHEICLASPTRDSIECSGDSGGPSIIKDDASGEYYQVGIVSWGSGGCDTHYGTAHTRIAGLKKWIKRQIAGRPVKYETVDSRRPISYYCEGLDCVFDVSDQYYVSNRYRWTTDDGGSFNGGAIFKHRFSAAGDHEVRMVTNDRFFGRVTETLKLKVKRGRTDSDKMRTRLGNFRFFSGDSDFTKVLYDAGQGTWFYGGPSTFTLRSFDPVDFDLELWRFDFDSNDWQLIAFSAKPGRAPERITRNLKSGFYYANVVTNNESAYSQLTYNAQFSRRKVCQWVGPLVCRPGGRGR